MYSSSPFQLIIGSWWEGWTFNDFTHFLPAKAKVIDGPHVGEFHYLDLLTENQKAIKKKVGNLKNRLKIIPSLSVWSPEEDSSIWPS